MSDYRDTLIRLHTNDNEAFFDCNFNDDVVLKPNSQLALHSVSMERADGSLFIDSTNDEITFQTAGANENHTATIPPGKLNKGNVGRKLRELSDSMNAQLNIQNSAGGMSSTMAGTRIQVSVNQNKKVEFNFAQNGATNIAQNPFQTTSVFEKNMTQATTNQNCSRTAGNTNHLNDAYMMVETPICMGVGYLSVGVRKLIDQATAGAGHLRGFMVGLTTQYTKAKAGQLTEADCEFLIRVPNLGETIQVQNSAGTFVDNDDGTRFSSGAENDYRTDDNAANFSTNNSHIVIQVEGDGFQQKVFGMKYQSLGGTYEATNVLFSSTIPVRDSNDEIINYYPVISIQGNPNQCKLGALKMASDPYYQSPIEHNDTLGAGLPVARTGNRILNVTLPPTVAQFFGYTQGNILNPNLDSIPRDARFFVGNIPFENQIVSDNYLIEMLNIPLISFDSLKFGRKNLLEVIPASETHIDDDTGLVQYQPNERVFIDVGNKIPLLLRNIRARIVNTDYSTIDLVGLASLNLVLRNMIEK